tara:strand:- start:49 stop:573 length:525 start_codon:yes stop_codon:yes gene_type:complete
VGKKKKIGIVIITVIIILFSFTLLLEHAKNEVEKMEEYREEIKTEWLSNFTFEEAESIAIDWNYKDMLRNIDNYSNELIFVEGVVKSTQRDSDVLTLYVNCDTEPKVICHNNDRIFVHVHGITNTWLVDDHLSGFVKVTRLSEVGKFSDTTGEWIGSGNYIPRTDEIKLTCSNC